VRVGKAQTRELRHPWPSRIVGAYLTDCELEATALVEMPI